MNFSSLFNFKAIAFAAGAITIIMVILAAEQRGVERCELEMTAQHQAEMIELNRQQAHQLQIKQNQILEIEQAWLDQDPEIKKIYQDRVKTVTQTVTEYVESHNLAHCRLDADSLQHINAALSGAGQAYGVKLYDHDLPGFDATQ